MPDTLRERLQAVLGDAYRIERELPAGGMSRLFVATERSLGRDVVVKVLPPDLASAVSAARFQREMSMAAHLQHPHIVPVLTAGSQDEILFYVMPYVTGESLRDRLERGGRIPVDDAVRILGEVAGALAYAHQRGIVHRDVKPENILLEAGHAVLTDFGIAQATTGETDSATAARLTATGVSLGTPGYMAPEQVTGGTPLDARTDVYALAVVGFEMLAGTRPFTGASPRAVLAAHLLETPPAVITLRPETPPAVSAAIEQALAKDPADRPANGEEFLRSLGTATTGPRTSTGSGTGRSRLATIAIAAAVLLVAVGAWALRRFGLPVTPLSLSTVAVLPFEATGTPGSAYLGAGMVDLLSATLDGAGELHTVDPRAVLAAAARTSPTTLDPDGARKVAGQLGAGRYVLGTVVDVGGKLRVGATLHDGGTGATIARATADGDTSDVFGLVDRLAAQLLAGRLSGASARITKLASVTTRSLPALKAYLEGETAFRRNDFEAALAAFQRAIAADTGFALAYFRLSLADEWLTHTADAIRSAESAVRHGDRLSTHDRQLLDGLLAERRGDVLGAERIFRGVIATYPDDYEAWWQLGEIEFHSAPVIGLPLVDAERPFRRVLELDPVSEPALVHLARIAADGQRRATFDSLVARSLTEAPAGDRSYEMRIDRAIIDGDSAGFTALLGELRSVNDFAAFLPAWSLERFVHDLDAAARVYGVLLDPTRQPEVRARIGEAIAEIDIAHGRLADADTVLTRVASISPAWALESHGLIAALPYLPVDSARARTARSALERWDADRAPDVTVPAVEFSGDNGLHPLIRAYLIGLLDAELGDSAAASRLARSIPDLPAARAHRPLAETLASAIVDESSWWPGRTPVAVEPRVEEFYQWLIGSLVRSQARERFRRAQALVAAGQDTAALRWYSSFETAATDDVLYITASHLERARLYARLGRRAEAAEQYRKFLALWQHCDPPLRPIVAQAERELKALE